MVCVSLPFPQRVFWTIYPQCAAFARLRGAGALPGVPPDGRATDGAQKTLPTQPIMPKRRTVPCDVSSLALWQCEAAYDRLGCPAAFASTNL